MKKVYNIYPKKKVESCGNVTSVDERNHIVEVLDSESITRKSMEVS